MAKLDFPSSPTYGMRYPDPAVPGIPVYTWDLEKWVASGPVGSPPQAPFDAMAYSGMQVNGSMDVNQDPGPPGTVTSNTYCLDCWLLGVAAVGATVGASQVASATKFPGFQNYLFINNSAAKPTLDATDYVIAYQPIEGYRISRLAWGTANAQPITISFWSAHHRTGVYSIVVVNSGQNRNYVTTYTQAVADVAQYNTVTIPGETNGTWEATTGVGMYIYFTFACGASNISPSTNTWGTTPYIGATGQVNGITNTSDVSAITGVIVLPGTQAPTATQSPNIMRSYDQEFMLCKRYYEVTTGGARGVVTTNNILGCWVAFEVEKRAIPSLANGGGGVYNIYAFQSFVNATPWGCSVQFQGNGSGSDNYCYGFYTIANARL